MDGLAKTKIVVVCGPTASGKTGLALALSKEFGGEMIGADSMQVYNGLTVGTAAVTPEEAAGVPQHLVGFLPPETPYSVAEYVAEAAKAIKEVAGKGRLPVVCGGTGLYISSLVNGTIFDPRQSSEALRGSLQRQFAEKGGAYMLQKLQEVDPACAARLYPKDEKRIVRALELWELTGKTQKQREQESRPENPPYNALCIGLGYSNRQLLYARIEQRVDEMLREGVLEEALLVYKNKESYTTAAQAIGYKEFFPYFEGRATLEECAAKLKQATRNYAKRQLTWFRRMPAVNWIQADETGAEEKAAGMVRSFLK